jgi:hypothetical protein
MNMKSIAAAVALVLSAPAMAATCSGGTSLGTLGPPGAAYFGQSFSGAGSYLDCYSFSLSSAADSFGGVLEIDVLLNKLDIDVTGVSLFSGVSSIGQSTGGLIGSDYTAGYFSFGSLAAGAYTLAVASTVSRDAGLWNAPVGYLGLLATSRATVASPAPEPETYAMMLAGLVGIGAMVRRRKKS